MHIKSGVWLTRTRPVTRLARPPMSQPTTMRLPMQQRVPLLPLLPVRPLVQGVGRGPPHAQAASRQAEAPRRDPRMRRLLLHLVPLFDHGGSSRGGGCGAPAVRYCRYSRYCHTGAPPLCRIPT